MVRINLAGPTDRRRRLRHICRVNNVRIAVIRDSSLLKIPEAVIQRQFGEARLLNGELDQRRGEVGNLNRLSVRSE